MISVICPIYNEEKYIGKCIDSVLRQDYPKEDMEVLFVDGMSTDRTREIVAAYGDFFGCRTVYSGVYVRLPALSVELRFVDNDFGNGDICCGKSGCGSVYLRHSP